MGDPNSDSENPVLKEEQDAQVLLYNINCFFFFQFILSFNCLYYIVRHRFLTN